MSSSRIPGIASTNRSLPLSPSFSPLTQPLTWKTRILWLCVQGKFSECSPRLICPQSGAHYMLEHYFQISLF